MSLSKARKILCCILTVVLAAGSMLFFGSLITSATVLSENYVVKVFELNDASSRCKEEFKKQLTVLEAKSSIPERVFDAVYNFDEISNDSVIRRLFSSADTTLYTEDEVQRFEQLCKEYLEGNNIKYDKELIHNTALEATELYSQCFGMQNSQELSSFIQNADEQMQKLISIGGLLVMVSIIVLLILHRKSKDIMFNIFAALTLQGFAFIVSGILSLIFKVGQNIAISPQIYADAFADCAKGACVVSIIFGVISSALSLCANISITKKSDKSPL